MASVAGLHYGLLDGFAFMVLVGIGLYLPYVAIHTTIFERLIAMTRDRGNLGYLMYLADAFGYLGYPIFMLLGRPLFGRSDALSLFSATCLIMATLSMACTILAAAYFHRSGESGDLTGFRQSSNGICMDVSHSSNALAYNQFVRTFGRAPIVSKKVDGNQRAPSTTVG